MGRRLAGLGQEARSAARGLRRRPAFALLVVLTLGLGIGATTTIFSVVDAILIRSLPEPDADRLVSFGAAFPDQEWTDRSADLMDVNGLSVANFVDWQARVRTLDWMAVIEPTTALMSDEGNGPELIGMASVSEGFFELLGVTPSLGRGFQPADFLPGAPPARILSFASWRDRFGADPALIGKPLTGSTGRTNSGIVIGVLPADFRPPEALGAQSVEIWTPLDPSSPRYASRERRSVLGLGRLAEGASLDAARAELASIQAVVATEFPEGNVYPDGKRLGAAVNGLQVQTIGTSGRVLRVFLASAALLLVIAGLNAANLMLVRGLDREGELALRRALGAGRLRIAVSVLSETIALALLAGAIGLGLAAGGVALFKQLAPPSLPRLEEVAVNFRVLGLAVATALGAGMLIGLPMVRARSRDLFRGLRETLGVTASPRGVRLRAGLVAVQLALAVMLAVGATLLFRSFVEVRSVDPGFDAGDLTTFSFPAKVPGEDRAAWQVWEDLERGVAAIPGVEAVAIGSNLPFQSPNWAPGVKLPGESEADARRGISGYAVTPAYFGALGVAIRRGRGIEPGDGADGAPVAVVNEAFTDAVLRGVDPIGATISISGAETLVVGVVANVVQTRAEEGSKPAIYVPSAQSDWSFAQVAIRSTRPLSELGPEIKRAAAAVSRVVPVMRLGTMAQSIGSGQVAPRFQAVLIGGFAGVALLLAGIGLYGTMAHTVGRRARELGIRMAIGARGEVVLRSVLRQGLSVAAIGLGVGLTGAALVSRTLETLLFGIAPLDGPTFVGAAIVLLLVAVLSVLRPALRAARTDPTVALRADS